MSEQKLQFLGGYCFILKWRKLDTNRTDVKHLKVVNRTQVKLKSAQPGSEEWIKYLGHDKSKAFFQAKIVL